MEGSLDHARQSQASQSGSEPIDVLCTHAVSVKHILIYMTTWGRSTSAGRVWVSVLQGSGRLEDRAPSVCQDVDLRYLLSP